jgi:hypothetical protein
MPPAFVTAISLWMAGVTGMTTADAHRVPLYRGLSLAPQSSTLVRCDCGTCAALLPGHWFDASLHALLLLHGDPASGPIALSRLAIRTDDGCRHAPSVQRTAATMPWPGSARPDTFALIAALVRQPGL